MAKIVPNQKFLHGPERFEEGNTYEVSDELAAYFVRVGWATADIDVDLDGSQTPPEVDLEVDKADHGQTGVNSVAKSVHDSVLDGAWDILDQATLQIVCSAEPTTRTQAVTTYALADVAMTPNTDYTKANGDVSGRKVTMAAKSAVPIDTSGTATHVALVDGTNLLYVTTCTSQALTSGNTVNIPAWDAEIADPA